MTKNKTIEVIGSDVAFFNEGTEDYISLTDLAKHKNAEYTGVVISHWLSTRYTVEFMGIWERVNNPDFNLTEFSYIRNESGSNGYVLSAKQWVEKTNAIGIISKAGRYGGTYAHKDIAFEFATWISPELKFYLIKEFQRLKEQELQQLGWGHPPQPDQNQLPHPYRRYQSEPDSPRINIEADQFHLCQRGGSVEHGPVRQNSETVAGRKSG